MGRMNAKVLLVGSVPGTSVEDVFSVVEKGVGDLLGCVPDGEIGHRRIWINFLAWHTYQHHPDLEVLSRPLPVDPSDPKEWRGPGDDWVPQGYHDHWLFTARPGITKIRFKNLGYAEDAAKSYAIFKKMRAAGKFARDTRFQVALPLTESGIRPFLPNAKDFPIFWDAYEEAMRREIEAIADTIPPADLAVQWDICMEILAAAVGDGPNELFRWKGPDDPIVRYRRAIAALSPIVPEEAWLGFHLCYGDLGHRHFVEPQDLDLAVEMANIGVRAAGRSIDFHHVPVPRDRDDDAYFAPLKKLAIGDGRMFLGLVHHTGGKEATLKRVATAKRHLADFGVATECGFGRRPADQIPDLLAIHRAAAGAV